MARETWVQSQVESYQRLKKWYLMPPCLTLSIIRYGTRVKWSNPGKGVAPSPTPWCSKLSKREPSGHPRLWSPTLLTYEGNAIALGCNVECPYSITPSSCRVTGTDFLSPTTRLYRPSLPTSPPDNIHVRKELLQICSSWSSNTCSSVWRDPQENVASEFVLTSTMFRVSCSSDLDGFRDGR